MERTVQRSSVEALAALMRGRLTVVLSGAGISTESGIPDYRGAQGGLPNAGHMAVARLESRGSVAGVITQNVDSV